jgi:hypothetical protein
LPRIDRLTVPAGIDRALISDLDLILVSIINGLERIFHVVIAGSLRLPDLLGGIKVFLCDLLVHVVPNFDHDSARGQQSKDKKKHNPAAVSCHFTDHCRLV